MSDYNSSLPIRTQNAGDAIVKVADATTPGQQLAVNADGSLNITDNSSSITVDATDLDIRDLSSASDSILVLQSVHDDLNANVNLQIDNADVANGNPVPVSDAGGSITVDATDLDVRDLTHASDSVKIGDGTDFLAVNSNGSINVVVSNDIPGNEICNYQTSAAVAAAASVNHDYTVTALNTFIGEQVVISGSGKLKAEVLFNGVAKFTAFNSTSEPNIIIPLLRTIKAAAGQVIRITITNRDNQAQDLYSTLMGIENT